MRAGRDPGESGPPLVRLAAVLACLGALARAAHADESAVDCSIPPTSPSWTPLVELIPPPRPPEQPLRRAPEIDVRSFGARGDGQSDDTAAINRAFAALPADGGSVHFPAGEYVVSSNLDLVVGKRNVEVYGDGMFVSILRRTAVPGSGRNFGVISVAKGVNWTIRDLGIVGDASRWSPFNHFGKGIYFVDSPGSVIFRVEVARAEGEGIYASGDSPGTRMLENFVRHGHGAALNLNSSRTTSEGSVIADNVVLDNRSGAVQATASRLTVQGNLAFFPWPLGSDIILIVNAGQFSCNQNLVLDSDISAAGVSPIHLWVNDGLPMQGDVCGNRILNVRMAHDRRGGGAGIHIDGASGPIRVRSNVVSSVASPGPPGQPAIRINGAPMQRFCLEANSFAAGPGTASCDSASSIW